MITVFGSINVDFVTRVDHIPAAGETVLGPDYQVFAGGKGGNQALAAARAGASVRMVGAVGHDPFATIGTALLKQARIDLAPLTHHTTPTGAAFIAVSAAGDSFCGAFAAALDRGLGLTGALQHGAAAGSLACQTLGAQSSIPDKDAIEKALEGQVI